MTALLLPLAPLVSWPFHTYLIGWLASTRPAGRVVTDVLTRPDDTDPPPTRGAADRRAYRAAVHLFDRLHLTAHLADRNHCGSPCRVAHVPAPTYTDDGRVVVKVARELHGVLLGDWFVSRVEAAHGVTVVRGSAAVVVRPVPRGPSPI